MAVLDIYFVNLVPNGELDVADFDHDCESQNNSKVHIARARTNTFQTQVWCPTSDLHV